jgi:hypothetical protein
VALGRLFYSLIFIAGGLGHFSPQQIAYAASQGVAIANILVPVSGIIAMVGGLGHSSRLSWKSQRMATRALSRAGDFHDAQFLGAERSHDAAASDGHIREEYFHAGRGSFLHASRNRPAEPRFPPWAGPLIWSSGVLLDRSAFRV